MPESRPAPVSDVEWIPVRIGHGALDEPTRIVLERRPVTVAAGLETAIVAADSLMRSGGSVTTLWSALATLAAHDLQCARAAEPHLDAVTILREAGPAAHPAAALGRTWGVFAAEGASPRLSAGQNAHGWTLSGVKPWCSLANTLSAALVTAWVGDSRRLFAVDLRQLGVVANAEGWHARGLVDIPSGPVRFTDVPAIPVGETGWYVERPGFSWGGIGVAACWYGGAVAIARTLREWARHGSPTTMVDVHLGAMDEVLTASRIALTDAMATIDSGELINPGLLAKRVRGIVARGAEEVIWRAGHAMGPGPLATDAPHAQRVADLQLYIRQHHAERDQESLGRTVRDLGEPPW